MISPAPPRTDQVHSRSSPVLVGLTCTTQAPACFARDGMRAAGCTKPEVPMANNRSHFWAASNARRNSLTGRSSPNQTTPGRTKPPQIQTGGLDRRPPSGSTGMPGGKMWAWPQVAQRGECRLPWRCSTSVLPARSCRSSTFCVTMVSLGTSVAKVATAMWAGFAGATELAREMGGRLQVRG